MDNLYKQTLTRPSLAHTANSSDPLADLSRHGWKPQMNAASAEEALAGSPSYTYVTYPRAYERGFAISFVNVHGYVEHHPLTLLSPIYGIWRNHGSQNIGTLDQVVTMMMYGNKGQPL